MTSLAIPYRSRRACVLSLVLAGVWICSGCSQARADDEAVEIVTAYSVAPERPLPEGLKAVAVMDAAVRAGQAGGDEREAKWAALAGDMIEAMLVGAGERFNTGVTVADRRNMKLVLNEQDLRAAGLVDSDTAHQVGRLLEVQALIISRITIDIDYQRGTKTTIDWGAMLGGALQGLAGPPRPDRPPPPPPRPREQRVRVQRDARTGQVRRVSRVYRVPASAHRPPEPAAHVVPLFQTREVEEIARYLSVQCSFTLLDAVTGQTVLNYSPAPYRKTDKASPDFLFGTYVNENDLDPVDHFIGELVEQATREFVGKLVPMETQHVYVLEGRGKEGRSAVRALRADEFETALELFTRAHKKDPDKPDNAFALGALSEALGRWEDALGYFRAAASSSDADGKRLNVYLEAKNRLADEVGRIIASVPPEVRPLGNGKNDEDDD